MRKKMAHDFCIECINQVLSSGAESYIENPAVKFTEMAENGDFDPLSDQEYNILLAEVEALSKLFNYQSRRAAGSILLDIMTGATKVSYKLRDDLATLFGRLLSSPDNKKIQPLPENALKAMEEFKCEQTEQMLDDLEGRFDHVGEELLRESLGALPPKKIRDNVSKKVLGQPEAVKTAAMIVYNHLTGRRTNAVFCGPSGCGKSEIWRTLTKEYPGLVRMVDFSRFSAEGWNGSLHLRDIFDGVDANTVKHLGLIVVLDEADKILCEHAIGGGGTDHNALLQNDLLKMMDGDVIEFGEDGKKAAMSVDCSKVSVVMLGAFENLLVGKAQGAKHIGFGSGANDTADTGNHKDISYNDLIHAGMRREIAGRVNKIIALEQLSLDDYRSILSGPVLSGLQEATGCKISIDGAASDVLAERAIALGLGVRWMRSEILNAIDDAMFDTPNAREYAITLRDGELRSQARIPRKRVSARAGRGRMEYLPF